MIERIVGEKVRAARKKVGFSREHIAAQTGFPKNRIIEIENGGIQDIQNADMWGLARAIGCRPEDILDMTSSHSEREIYDGCIRLMHRLAGEFMEWLEWQGVEVSEDETFATTIPCAEIVRELFLLGTGHDGGTSCHMKLRELGVTKYGEQFDCFPEEEPDDDEDAE